MFCIIEYVTNKTLNPWILEMIPSKVPGTPAQDCAEPTPRVSSWSMEQKEERAKSHCRGPNVLKTISQARAPSTRRLYSLKWSVFSTWCTTRGPEVCDISLILSFPQELLEKGHSLFMLKAYVASIAASHAPIDGQSVGRNNLVVRFLKGSRRLNPPRPVTVPTWDLLTVLRAVKNPPFKPLQSVDLRPLTLKTALLLGLA